MELRTHAWWPYNECCGGLRDAAAFPFAEGPAPIRLLLGIIFNTLFSFSCDASTLAVCKTLAKPARRRHNQSERSFAASIARAST